MTAGTKWIVTRIHGVELYRSSLLILGTQAVTSAIGYLFWALAARGAGPATTGQAGSLVSAVGAAVLLGTTGLTVGTIANFRTETTAYEMARHRLGVGLAMAACSLASGITLWLLIPVLMPSLRPAQSALAAPVVLAVVSTGFGQLLDGLALAMGRTEVMLLRGATASILRLGVFAESLHPGVVSLIWGFALATAASVALSYYLLRMESPGCPIRDSLIFLWSRRHNYLGHHLTSVCGAAAVYLLPIMVLNELGAVQAGFFYPSWLLGGLFFSISPAVANAYLAQGKRQDLFRNGLRAVAFTCILLAPPSIIVLLDPALVLQLLGPGYVVHATALLIVLAISAFPDAVTNIGVSAMRLKGWLKRAVSLNLLISGTSLLFAYFLLPKYGLVGAGYSWLGAQVFGALTLAFLLRLGRVRKETGHARLAGN